MRHEAPVHRNGSSQPGARCQARRWSQAFVLSLFATILSAPADAQQAAVRPPGGPVLKDIVPTANAWPLARGGSRSLGVAAATVPNQPKVLWRFQGGDAAGFEAPCAIADGTVYAPCLDGFLYALDLTSGEVRWKFESPLGFRSGPAVLDDAVYLGDSDGIFYRLDRKTGAVRWRYKTEAEINSSANFHGDLVLVGSQDATLYALRRDSGQEAWKYTLDEQIQCGITVADGYVFIAGCDSRMHVLEAATGKTIHQVEIGDPTGVTPAADGDRAYFGTQGGKFLCVDWRKGRLEWTFEDPTRKLPIHSSPAVAEGLAVYGTRGKFVYAIRCEDGKQVWRFPTKGRVDSSPVIVGGRLFLGSSDGRVYALGLKDGKLLWEYEAGGSFVAGPAVADGRLVIGTDRGTLYCFGAP